MRVFGPRNSAYAVNLTYDRHTDRHTYIFHAKSRLNTPDTSGTTCTLQNPIPVPVIVHTWVHVWYQDMWLWTKLGNCSHNHTSWHTHFMRGCNKIAISSVTCCKDKITNPCQVKPSSQYDASQRVIHLKPVQNRSQVTHDDAHPFSPKRLNRNLFYSCVRVATRHIVN